MIDRVINTLESNRARKLNGDLIAIPWSLPRLSRVLPGVRQKHYTIISSQSKGAKSQIANFLYMFEPIEWYLRNRNSTNISLKIFLFSLEISRDLVVIQAISYKLFKTFGVIISPDNLQSIYADYTLDEKILAYIKSPEMQIWLKEFESIVEIIDDVRHGLGIMKIVQAYAEANGHYEYKDMMFRNDDGTQSMKKVIDRYIPDRPDEYVIVMVDHIGLIEKSANHANIYDAIGELSSRHFLKMRDRFGYQIVAVQQQSADSTDAQYTVRGDIVIDKLKSTPEGLALNKSTKNDCNLMISLFWPYMYKIQQYGGASGKDWDMARIGNNYREFNINLNRNGISSASIDLMFLGACNYFAELPREPNERVYQQIADYNKNTI